MGNSNSVRVLVVDDHRDFADSMVAMLERWGHEAKAAYGAIGAIWEVESFKPKVMLVDLTMPTIDGFSFARHVHRLGTTSS